MPAPIEFIDPEDYDRNFKLSPESAHGRFGQVRIDDYLITGEIRDVEFETRGETKSGMFTLNKRWLDQPPGHAELRGIIAQAESAGVPQNSNASWREFKD